EHFRANSYGLAFIDGIRRLKPSVVLVGATPIGKAIAPFASTKFQTGLTADCTQLELDENTDLIQIRPAFGGNVMAQIMTPYTRPQFATVRYNMMNPVNLKEGYKPKCEIHALPEEARAFV